MRNWQIKSQLLLDLGLAELAGRAYTDRYGNVVNYAPPSDFTSAKRTTSNGLDFTARVYIERISVSYIMDGKIISRDYKTERGLIKALAHLDYLPAVAMYRSVTIDKILRDLA